MDIRSRAQSVISINFSQFSLSKWLHACLELKGNYVIFSEAEVLKEPKHPLHGYSLGIFWNLWLFLTSLYRHKKEKKRDKERDRDRRSDKERSREEREHSTSKKKKSKDKERERERKSDGEKGDVKVGYNIFETQSSV